MPETLNNEVKDLKILADLMDSRFELPWGFRIGFDGILGMIPFVGGLMTTLVSAYIVGRAALLKVSVPVLLRMVLNIVIDNAISVFPLFGWIGDFMWKANNKNLALIEAHRVDPRKAKRHSTGVLVAILGTLFVSTFALAFLAAAATWWALNLVIEWFGGL